MSNINIIHGILITLMAIAICHLSWTIFKKDKYNIALSLLLLCGLGLRLFVSADGYLHDWDEQFHALVAKNLVNHPLKPTLYEHPVLDYDYKKWGENHIWLHKQPLALWGMALGIKSFGTNEWAIRLPTIFLSCLAIWLTYGIGKQLFDRQTAWFATFLHAIHGYIIELTGGRVATDHTDIYFLVFIELGIYLSVLSAKYPTKRFIDIIIGISAGLAVLAKWLPGLIILPVYILLHINKKTAVPRVVTGVCTVFIICLVTFLPWQLYTHQAFPLEAAWEKHYNWIHITKAVEGHEAPWHYHLTNIPMLFGEIVYIPILWFFYKTFKKRNIKYLALAMWVLIPYIFFTLVATKMKAYILFTAPAIFIITGLFIRFIIFYKSRINYRWFFNLILILLIVLPVRYSIERVKPFSQKPRHPEWTLKLKELAKNITEKNAVIFNLDNPIKAMFYGNFTAYSRIPKTEKIKALIAEGYTIYFYNIDQDIKEVYREIEGIYFIE